MDSSTIWWLRRYWGGLNNAQFAASERARARLAHTFPAPVFDALDQCHPARLALLIPALQPRFTRLGEALHLFVPKGGRSEKAIAADLLHESMYHSRLAELEVALYFRQRDFAVIHQPTARGKSGPDLHVRGPSGRLIPVEVKAPRRSEKRRAHERFVLDCMYQYQSVLDEKGLRQFALMVERHRVEPSPWSGRLHRQTLAFLHTLPKPGQSEPRRKLDGDWSVRLQRVHGFQTSATAWGLELVADPSHDARRLRGHLAEASRQLEADGPGFVVLHGVLSDRDSVTPALVAQAMSSIDARPIAHVLACDSDRSGVRMEVVA